MSLTPMMQQYMEVKEQHRDCILFFRLGDFYEMFFDDAVQASQALEITLTGRDCGLPERAPMCGIPYHAVDHYLTRLVSKGFKVAICDQLEDPALAKGLVVRDVVRVVTPGTVIEPALLEDKSNAYLMSVFKEGRAAGLAVTDLTTGVLFAASILWGNTDTKLVDEISKYMPKEIIASPGFFEDAAFQGMFAARVGGYSSKVPEDYFDEQAARARLARYFPRGAEPESPGRSPLPEGVRQGSEPEPEDVRQGSEPESEGVREGSEPEPEAAPQPFGPEPASAPEPPPLDAFACRATGALLRYLEETQKRGLGHLSRVVPYSVETFMMIDAASRRNLEITESIKSRARAGSLIDTLDRTLTPSGGRMLKNWFTQPLVDIPAIEARHLCVQELLDGYLLRSQIRERMRRVRDIERLISRIVLGGANCRDFLALRSSLAEIPGVKTLLANAQTALLRATEQKLDPLEDVAALIFRAISEDAPIALRDGNVIREGYNAEVDKLRAASRDGKSWLAALEKDEREKTGIKNLKVGFNKVFGYFFEVTRLYANLVPPHYVRRQTLANCERYISDELKQLEDTILGAEERLIGLEQTLFNEVRELVSAEAQRVKRSAEALAELDALAAFAELADREGYCRPKMNARGIISIREGRHPVVESFLGRENFVPNDAYLDTGEHRTAIITGPNMAGKSTYMRQIALIVLMAQAGCFVPAAEADIGLTDRIFTRVGAADDLAAGQSTFMVEMSEVANILENATSNSLLILDEIGRGTSTFDGLAIAWAVVEFINDKNKIGARTLFSTHYHELTELSGKVEGVNNFCVSIAEEGDGIRFLRKIKKGGADGSYGIHVAKLAGLPASVTDRANELLAELEAADISKKAARTRRTRPPVEGQVDFLSVVDAPRREKEVLDALRAADLTRLTPIEALNNLYALQQKLKLG